MTIPEEPVEELSPEDERELELAIVSAYRPGHINPELNEFLVQQALVDPLAAASEEELTQSERLRDALEGKSEHPDLALIDALRSAKTLDASSARASSNVVWLRFGAAAGTLAAAAALALLLVRPFTHGNRMKAEAPLAVSRSTSSLFHQKFEVSGTTERLDRIASVRLKELRANRFRTWDVP